MARSFVDDLEQIVEETAAWGAEATRMTVEKLMPDGRPFMMEKKSKEDELEEYMMLRGNQMAWEEKIHEWAHDVMMKLQGMPEDVIAAAHPYNIAIVSAYEWSGEMERLLREDVDGPSG